MRISADQVVSWCESQKGGAHTRRARRTKKGSWTSNPGIFFVRRFARTRIWVFDSTLAPTCVISSIVLEQSRKRERTVLTAFFQSPRVFVIARRANLAIWFQMWGVFSTPAGSPQRILLTIAWRREWVWGVGMVWRQLHTII